MLVVSESLVTFIESAGEVMIDAIRARNWVVEFLIHGTPRRERKKYASQKQTGFTLVELLAVVTIIGLLTAMLIPAVQMVREAARRNHCGNNARQIALALHLFEGAHGYLPPTLGSQDADALLHWQARTLSFLEQPSLYREIELQIQDGIHPFYNPYRLKTVPVFQCTSDPELGLLIPSQLGFKFAFTDYCGVAGVRSEDRRGVFRDYMLQGDRFERSISFNQITDGLSNTLMFGERPPNSAGQGYGSWLGSQDSLAATIGMFETRASLAGYAADLVGCNATDLGYQPGERGGPCSWTHHWSFHPGGANFARADASIHFVPYATDRETLSALATRDGGESLN